MPEAFPDDADAQAPDAAAERFGVARYFRRILPWIQPVGARQHFQQQRVVAHVARHRPGVIERELDRHHAGIRHETVSALHAVDAAEGRGNADRAALVAADRHVGFAGRDHHRAARRRAAGRIAHFVRIVDGTRRAGVAAAGEAEIFAMRLADDGAAGVEHAGDDRRVGVGRVAFERRGAVHHRHARDADIVLDRDLLAGELAARRALDLGLDVPGVVFVLLAFRTIARRARIFHGRHIVGHRVDRVVGGDSSPAAVRRRTSAPHRSCACRGLRLRRATDREWVV